MSRSLSVHWRPVLGVALLLGGALSCGDSSTAPNSQAAPVARILFADPSDSVEIGTSRTLAVQLFDGQGQLLSGRHVTWQSADTTIATVDASGGVTGRHLGVTTITASADSASGSVALVVRSPEAARMTLATASYQMVEGDTLTIAPPQVIDRTGAKVTDRPVTFSVASGTAVTVSPSGFVTATTAGSAIVSAHIDTVVAQITFTVTPAPVGSVKVIPSLADVAVGRSLHTQATAYAASGVQLTGRQYTYRSANPNVATVTSAGVINGIAPGTTTVTVSTTGGSFAIPVSVAQLGGGTFHIDLRFLGNVSPTLRTAATEAAARWEQVITQPLVPYQVIAKAGDCGKGIPAVNELVPNMIIYVQADSIDGAGKIAGQGGPCIIRDDAPQLTALGTLQVDTADVAWAANNGVLTDLLTHEMGHIMGIGTLWGPPFFPNTATGLGTGNTCGANPQFTGHAGRVSSAALGFTSDSSQGVPIENTGGLGTCDAHWRATVFGQELMTGTLHANANPLSLVTIEALADLGYGVTPQAADDFSILNATHPLTFATPSLSRAIPINEQVNGPRFTVTRSGQLNPIRARLVPVKP
jgi:uncharacterized protein YjdB